MLHYVIDCLPISVCSVPPSRALDVYAYKMASQHVLDHSSNVYLTVTTSSSAAVSSNPQSLAIHPSISYLGPVGQLRDVHLLGIPRESWELIQDNVLSTLKGMPGGQRVDMEQPPRMRAKRNIDDL